MQYGRVNCACTGNGRVNGRKLQPDRMEQSGQELREGTAVFAWWWLVVALVVGACIGAVLMGIYMANRADLGNARKWNDDE